MTISDTSAFHSPQKMGVQATSHGGSFHCPQTHYITCFCQAQRPSNAQPQVPTFCGDRLVSHPEIPLRQLRHFRPFRRENVTLKFKGNAGRGMSLQWTPICTGFSPIMRAERIKRRGPQTKKALRFLCLFAATLAEEVALLEGGMAGVRCAIYFHPGACNLNIGLVLTIMPIRGKPPCFVRK